MADRLGSFKTAYCYTAVMSFNVFLLFLAVNGIIYLVSSHGNPGEDFYYRPAEVYERADLIHPGLYGEYTASDAGALMSPPGLTSHPTLEFMGAPSRSKFYNVGFENIRYTRHGDKEKVRKRINGAVWLFGGSTVFGYGIGDDDTIAFHLNDLDPDNLYLNFAVQSFHQNLEIDKMILLLKKGFRPKGVIFIDGLNDISAMRETNFHPAETPMRLHDSFGGITNMLSLRRPWITCMLNRLPLFEVLITAVEKGRIRDEARPLNAYDDIYDPDCLYNRKPLLHYRFHDQRKDDFAGLVANIEFYQGKLLAYYKLNNEFLDRLSKAFDFEYSVFIQPLGNLSLENPFLKDPASYKASPTYNYFRMVLSSLRDAVRKGVLPNFHDISDADAGMEKCYVDLTHYDSRLCRRIAGRILSTLEDR